VTSLDWASYPIITFNEIPDTIDIVFVSRPDLAADGASANRRSEGRVAGCGECDL